MGTTEKNNKGFTLIEIMVVIIILGILAMMNVAPVILGFIALLIIGVALTSTASTTKCCTALAPSGM